jgi:RNA polymerase sigma-70 factor (ECF subfamily)
MYRSQLAGLFGFLVYRTGDRELAEDLTAETFARALKCRSSFDRRKASERTWLYTIALNLLRDHARHVDAELRAIDRFETLAAVSSNGNGNGNGTAVVELVERRDLLQRALSVLSPEERDAIALRFGAELTIREIAGVTGQEPTTADGRVYRALRKLRAELVGFAEAV